MTGRFRPASPFFSSYFNFDQAREESILLGQQVNLSPLVVQNYAQNSDGFTVFASYPIKHAHFLRIGLSYGYTDTSINASSTAAEILFENLQFQSVAGASALNGIHQSRITPTLSYNTVDNPTDPSKGTSLFFSSRGLKDWAGIPAQSQTRLITRNSSPTYHKRNVIGIHFTGAFISRDMAAMFRLPSNGFTRAARIPFEGSIFALFRRSFSIPVPSSRSVTYTDPRKLDSNGNPQSFHSFDPDQLLYDHVSGRRYDGCLQWRVPDPAGRPLCEHGFLPRRGYHRRASAGSASAERAIVHGPYHRPSGHGVQQEFAICAALELRPSSLNGHRVRRELADRSRSFRIYYAYNVLRYDELIVAPQGDFYLSPELKNSLPPCSDTQILPSLTRAAANPAQFNYIDPLKTIRFTVSRTF